MTDYISREEAIESVREKVLICESLQDTIAKDASLFTLASMNDSLNSIPAADVRPVVLCRDCKHYKPQEKKSARWENRSMMCTRSATIKMPPEGFCSFGIKREES